MPVYFTPKNGNAIELPYYKDFKYHKDGGSVLPNFLKLDDLITKKPIHKKDFDSLKFDKETFDYNFDIDCISGCIDIDDFGFLCKSSFEFDTRYRFEYKDYKPINKNIIAFKNNSFHNIIKGNVTKIGFIRTIFGNISVFLACSNKVTINQWKKLVKDIFETTKQYLVDNDDNSVHFPNTKKSLVYYCKKDEYIHTRLVISQPYLKKYFAYLEIKLKLAVLYDCYLYLEIFRTKSNLVCYSGLSIIKTINDYIDIA